MRSRRRASGQFNSASMSDVAFLLLIFFLVTTIFALERGIPLVLPPDSAPKAKVKTENILTIQSLATGAITIDDKLVTLSQLRYLVEERLAKIENLVIVVESHPDSEYGAMVDILDELRMAKAHRISLKEMKVAER